MIPTARSTGVTSTRERVGCSTGNAYANYHDDHISRLSPLTLHRAGGALSSTKIQLHPEKFNYFSPRYETRKTRKPLRHNKFKDFSKR